MRCQSQRKLCSWNVLIFGGIAGFFSLLQLPEILFAQSPEERHQAVLKTIPSSAKSTATPDLEKASQQIVQLTNNLRKSEKRSDLTTNDELQKTAQKFAEFMANNNEYGHEADGRTHLERAQAEGYEPCLILENIAYSYSTKKYSVKSLASEFFEGWKKSPHHYQNMMDPDITEMGVGLARSQTGGVYYAVQLFGLPKSKMGKFEIANQSSREISYSVGDQSFTLTPHMVRRHLFCRPSQVSFEGAVDDDPLKTIQPKSGDEFVIKDGEETIHIEKKSAKVE